MDLHSSRKQNILETNYNTFSYIFGNKDNDTTPSSFPINKPITTSTYVPSFSLDNLNSVNSDFIKIDDGIIFNISTHSVITKVVTQPVKGNGNTSFEYSLNDDINSSNYNAILYMYKRNYLNDSSSKNNIITHSIYMNLDEENRTITITNILSSIPEIDEKRMLKCLTNFFANKYKMVYVNTNKECIMKHFALYKLDTNNLTYSLSLNLINGMNDYYTINKSIIDIVYNNKLCLKTTIPQLNIQTLSNISNLSCCNETESYITGYICEGKIHYSLSKNLDNDEKLLKLLEEYDGLIDKPTTVMIIKTRDESISNTFLSRYIKKILTNNLSQNNIFVFNDTKMTNLTLNPYYVTFYNMLKAINKEKCFIDYIEKNNVFDFESFLKYNCYSDYAFLFKLLLQICGNDISNNNTNIPFIQNNPLQ